MVHFSDVMCIGGIQAPAILSERNSKTFNEDPSVSDTAEKSKLQFGVAYDPTAYQLTHYKADEPYVVPKPLAIKDLFTYVQPWSGYTTTSHRPEAVQLPEQTANIKPSIRYRNAELLGNKWIELACDEALKSVKAGGGPFSSVIVQVDDESNRVIRYWISWNHVTEWNDPTAHGEVTAIRQACQELGVFDLGRILKTNPKLKLPQDGVTSHCELYSSAEPCPMCYSAIRWARIDNIFFAATVYDAAVQGVRFSDEPIYAELALNYADRKALGVNCYQCTVPNSLDAFNHFKRSDAIKY
jgi:tRNA(Arg) A34 adenosine deaminase TadA